MLLLLQSAYPANFVPTNRGAVHRWLLNWRGSEPHIAKRKTPHGSGLGKVRWVVERTIS